MAQIVIVGQEEPKEVEAPKEGISAPVGEELIRSSVEQVMGLEESGDKHRYRDKVDTLIEYAKTQTKDWSPESIKWVIRSIELKLGTPPFSEKRINYVAQYAWLCMETQRLSEEKEKFTQGGWK
jgi:hypothetical protein